jgi:hypothetical protein
MTPSAASILKLLRDDPAFVQQCRAEIANGDPRNVLEMLRARGIEATPDDLKVALLDFSRSAAANSAAVGPVGETPARAQTTGVDPSIALRDGFQAGLLGVVRQIDMGYQITMWMYTAAFALGMLMMLAALVGAFIRPGNTNLYLAGLGAADVITFLIFKPAQDLQASRGNLAQLQAAFFAWINDVHNWNRYLDSLEKESGKNAPPFDKAKEVSEIMVHNTERMVRLVGEYSKILDKLPADSKQHRGRSGAGHDRDSHKNDGQADAAPAAKK